MCSTIFPRHKTREIQQQQQQHINRNVAPLTCRERVAPSEFARSPHARHSRSDPAVDGRLMTGRRGTPRHVQDASLLSYIGRSKVALRIQVTPSAHDAPRFTQKRLSSAHASTHARTHVRADTNAISHIRQHQLRDRAGVFLREAAPFLCSWLFASSSKLPRSLRNSSSRRSYQRWRLFLVSWGSALARRSVFFVVPV